MENWREIAGTEGNFEVSDRGRVRNIDYISPKGRRIKAKIKKLYREKNGYLRVRITVDGEGKMCYVHRLVAGAFIHNPDPKGNTYTLHGDDNPSNNYVSNLRWGSQQHNMNDKVERGRGVYVKGEKHGKAKLTEKDVIIIKEMLESGEYTQKGIGKKFGVSNQIISYIKTGKRWSHV